MKMNKISGNNAQRGKRGRPPSKPVVLKDGFYFEVRNHSTDPGAGVKIWKATYEEMLEGVAQYRKTKQVTILGAYKDGKPFKKVSSREKKAA